jgi:hypothetical protein
VYRCPTTNAEQVVQQLVCWFLDHTSSRRQSIVPAQHISMACLRHLSLARAVCQCNQSNSSMLGGDHSTNNHQTTASVVKRGVLKRYVSEGHWTSCGVMLYSEYVAPLVCCSGCCTEVTEALLCVSLPTVEALCFAMSKKTSRYASISIRLLKSSNPPTLGRFHQTPFAWKRRHPQAWSSNATRATGKSGGICCASSHHNSSSEASKRHELSPANTLATPICA